MSAVIYMYDHGYNLTKIFWAGVSMPSVNYQLTLQW